MGGRRRGEGPRAGRTEEQVNPVIAPTIVGRRGIVVEEKSVSEAQDFNELIRVTVIAGGERVAVAVASGGFGNG